MSITSDDGTLQTELFEMLSDAGIDDPYTEIEHIFGCVDSDSTQGTRERALELARARASGTPLGYVIGRQRFMGIEIAVAPGVIIPRSETELLGWETVIRIRESHGASGFGARVIDMCCGSGNLACGIARALPHAEVWASDLMENCAALTHHNARRLGLNERIHVYHGDLFEPLPLHYAGHYDIIVCNPPYISTHGLRQRDELLRHEPRVAFDGGPYGVSLYQRLVREASRFLKRGGWMLFEMGEGQTPHIERLLTRAQEYDKVELVADRRGEFRVAAVRRSLNH